MASQMLTAPATTSHVSGLTFVTCQTFDLQISHAEPEHFLTWVSKPTTPLVFVVRPIWLLCLYRRKRTP